ncbi:MAG: helicase-related protein [Planctomycetota bacterium]
MPDHLANRDAVLLALRQELVGPCPLGQEIDCAAAVQLDDAETAYRPYRQLGTGEEILQRDSPTKRFGVGVLYPMEAKDEPQELQAQLPPPDPESDDSELESAPQLLQVTAVTDCERIAERAERRLPEADSDDFDLSSANAYRPNSMAASLLVKLSEGGALFVTATGGRYVRKEVSLIGRDREWWLRSPVRIAGRFRRADFPQLKPTRIVASDVTSENVVGLDVRIEVFARPQRLRPDEFLVTVCLINRQPADGRLDSQCLFQTHIDIKVNPGSSGAILPYPTAPPLDDEERSRELLYRKKLTFAVGHGCAADWNRDADSNRADSVSAECLPMFEAPNITPDVRTDTGQPLVASMRALAGLDPADDGIGAVETIIKSYEDWIAVQQTRIGSLEERLKETARTHLVRCAESAARMRDGLALLSDDPQIRRAFTLANLAILIQQIRSRREARIASFDHATSTLQFEKSYEELDLNSQNARDCAWRAFQIAFILASLRSTADSGDVNRDLVELIWFPTGGGKTEAYLGLAAFSIFLRRLRDSDDIGVQALMRYTLRLLTAQQFQRASRLVCAMEYLRRQYAAEFGKREITIGIWLGGSTTPNTRAEALAVFRSLTRGDGAKENQFVLDRCPWCGAQMGPVELVGRGRPRRGVPKVIGYEQRANTVVYTCPDRRCEFHQSLPLYVIDEDIYDIRPALLIGTVDKFAMLAWRPQARSLFGIAPDGTREYSPPGLIIQDELHLISGPLGSMVGLYEPIIEELCTDHRQSPIVKPKIISSTATIRSYEEQVQHLYARDRTCLFPPPGLDADDSFFARVARTPDGSLERGRIYVGVHAPGLGSLQTVQVRTFSALLQAPQPLPPPERDPWWTLLLFFNSLRELGTTLTLFQSDIPDLLKGALKQRLGLGYPEVRPIRKMLELTGRLPGDEVPKAISALEIPTDSQQGHAVDVCLASNIIEVGVDIDRLSLMAVVGQPKTTSQYIQVTGRVGRKKDRPGLVVTIYAASKPRDRSHFEKFRSYHERLYAQVEPTSVTPFSRPALDRAVHAVVASYVRQLGDSDQAESPYPWPEALIAAATEILEQRALSVDPDELAALQRILRKRSDEWQRWQRLRWAGALHAEDMPLLRPAGAYVSPDKARVSWATPQSLRNVDAECQVEITQLYMLEEDDNA